MEEDRRNARLDDSSVFFNQRRDSMECYRDLDSSASRDTTNGRRSGSLIVEIACVVIACGFLVPGLYLGGAADRVWILSIFILPLLWLFSGRHALIRFLINVAVFGSFFIVRSTHYFILSKAGFLRVSDWNLESWDDPYIVAFGMVIGLDVYFLTKRLIRTRFCKSQSKT
jgi:hypothetical protein